MNRWFFIPVMLLSLVMVGCGPRHIPTMQEQMQSQGYALQDNSNWQEWVRGLERGVMQIVFARSGATLEHYYIDPHDDCPLFAVGSNRTGKIEHGSIKSFYEVELTDMQSTLNAGELPQGGVLAANFDEEKLRYSIESIREGRYTLHGRIFTEKGWIFAFGSCGPDNTAGIAQIRRFFNSITLAPFLEYVLPVASGPSV